MTSPTIPSDAPSTSADGAIQTPPIPPRLYALSLAALGIVYGDIGTSPLYAIRECFQGPSSISLSEAHVLGVLSLITWSLLFIISFMYLAVILRADNDGEGGILSLTALVAGEKSPVNPGTRRVILLVGLFGAALLYGDGLVTPAISVLAAVEGLQVATPVFQPYVVPITILILIVLFSVQPRGTAALGSFFGPICLLWFVVLALLGLRHLAANPTVLRALDPRWGWSLLNEGGSRTFFVLGPVFLVITGGEALYADLGHFGRRPIQLAWYFVVLPSLLLNYLGQGALLLTNPAAVSNLFFNMAPLWFLLPLVGIATAATIIASQSAISEVFSLTRQGVLMGYLPRFEIRHTSRDEMGQIYVPAANWTLLCATVLLVVIFGSSSRMAAAYGVTVATTIVITSWLSFFAMRDLWGLQTWLAATLSGSFLAVGLVFFAANITKVFDGGWFPLTTGLAVYFVMTTWKRGRALLLESLNKQTVLDGALESALENIPLRVPGTAVYFTALRSGLPPALVQNLRHNQCLHQEVLFFTTQVQPKPTVPMSEQVHIEALGKDIFRVIVRHGFMEKPRVLEALARLPALGVPIDPGKVVFVLGHEILVPTESPGLSFWRKRLYCLLARNASMATAFYDLPAKQVLEIGIQVEF